MKSKLKNKTLLIIISIIFFLIIGLITYFIVNDEFSALKNNPFSTSRLNILIAGYDSSVNGPPRADTIIVASLDLDTSEVGALFVPRDTRVKVPGHGLDRVNASHAYGGIELTDKTLESFLDIPIDYYVETDFDGFSRIIDALGGVTINIEEPLNYVDEAGDLYIDLPAGKVNLNGEEALEYVRYREPTYGDIGRVERQQKFIRALANKVLQPETVVKLPRIYKEIRKAVKTDIPLKDVSPFVKLAKRMDLGSLETAMVPGKPKYINGASYWLPNKEKLDIVVKNLIRSKEYIKNSHYHVSIYNGNGEPGLAGELADRLNKYGFKIDHIANADNFSYQETIIKYYDKSQVDVVKGIKQLLGGKLEYIEDNKKGIRIIVGENYLSQEKTTNE